MHFIYKYDVKKGMRILAVLICMIVLVPTAVSLGVGVDSSVKDGFDIDEDEEFDVVFYMRGDGNTNDVEFFVELGGSQEGLWFNGDHQRWTDSFTLDPYENKEITVEVDGREPGEYRVFYGYVLEDDGSGFGIDSITRQAFTVEVDGDSTDNEDVDILVPSSSASSSSSSSGGGGGGGAFAGLYNQSEEKEEEPAPRQASDERVEANIQDVTGQNTALSEAAVDTSQVSSNKVSNIGDVDAKTMLQIILLIGFVAFLLNAGVLLQVARGER